MARKLKKKKSGSRRKASIKIQPSIPTPILIADPHQQSSGERLHLLKNGLTFDPNTYEIDDRFKPSGGSAMEAHTFQEMIHSLESDKTVEIEAIVLDENLKRRRISGRTEFLAKHKEAEHKFKGKFAFKENDYFASGSSLSNNVNATNGDDFTPLLGGPFYKQLYIYDYLRMISNCFYAWHHDPIAKATISIMRDFVLGRGFAVTCDSDPAMALWDAFCKVNKFDELIEEHFIETEVYGESMIWKLPKNELFISYQRQPDQEPPIGLLPRVRLIDPSCIWEIVTYPEDIKQVLFYQWVAPTQYQIYTAPQVPSTKFIFQQIPADEVIHVKTNCASNEKRGRSELFSSLGYLKRLRDSVNYAIIKDQKNSAWAIDTSIDGSQSDINNYASSQANLGTLPAAGSEFVHSKKVERKYLSSEGGKGGVSNSFDWCLSMIAAGSRIPVSYYGTHMSTSGSRASALVATEPVAKMFETKRLRIERTIREIFTWLTGKECIVTWPELISQDRSAKIADIMAAEDQGWLSKETAAVMGAKELDINDFDYEKEQEKLSTQPQASPAFTNPLTAPPTMPDTSTPASGKQVQDMKNQKPSAVTGDERKMIKDAR